MIAVALVAADMGLILGAEALDASLGSFVIPMTAFVLVPSLSLLAVAAWNVGTGLVRRRQAPPFSTGYLLVGGLVTFGMCLALALQAYMLFAVTVTTPNPLPEPSAWDQGLAIVEAFAITTLPQIVPALIGGVLATRLGLTIARGHRGSTAGAEGSASADP